MAKKIKYIKDFDNEIMLEEDEQKMLNKKGRKTVKNKKFNYKRFMSFRIKSKTDQTINNTIIEEKDEDKEEDKEDEKDVNNGKEIKNNKKMKKCLKI